MKHTHLIERVFTKIDGKFSGLAQYLGAKGEKIYDTYIPSTQLAGIVINKIKTHGMAYSGYTTDHTRHESNITRYNAPQKLDHVLRWI